MLADRFLGRAEAQSPRGALVDDAIGAARDPRSLGRRLLGARGGYVVGGTVRVEQPAGKPSSSPRFEASGIQLLEVKDARPAPCATSVGLFLFTVVTPDV